MSIKSNKDVTMQLEELGLSLHEAQIYLSVLSHGESPAGVILDDVKLHREQVYRALKRLVDQGYLTQFEKRKRSYFSAVDPSILVHQTTTKLSIAQSLQPYLKELHSKKAQIITVAEGEEAIKLQLEDMLYTIEDGGEYLIIGGLGQNYWEAASKYLEIFKKQFAKKNIKARIIAYEGVTYPKDNSFGEFNVSIKRIRRTMVFPASTAIYGDKVAIDLLDPENLAIITIENPKIANSYRQTFESLWK
jgi:sugar-specific transcriptional regulator TrmB